MKWKLVDLHSLSGREVREWIDRGLEHEFSASSAPQQTKIAEAQAIDYMRIEKDITCYHS